MSVNSSVARLTAMAARASTSMQPAWPASTAMCAAVFSAKFSMPSCCGFRRVHRIFIAAVWPAIGGACAVRRSRWWLGTAAAVRGRRTALGSDVGDSVAIDHHPVQFSPSVLVIRALRCRRQLHLQMPWGAQTAIRGGGGRTNSGPAAERTLGQSIEACCGACSPEVMVRGVRGGRRSSAGACRAMLTSPSTSPSRAILWPTPSESSSCPRAGSQNVAQQAATVIDCKQLL